MKNFWKLTVIVFLLSVSVKTFAATTTPATYTNLGFLQNGIWYSKDPFFDGEPVRIYTAVFNSSYFDLVGKVEFYDNGKAIGKTDFSVTSGGKIRDVWVDFTATKGAHKFSAKIVEAQVSRAGTTGEIIELKNIQTGTDTRTVDLDTDKDTIGNATDTDDDGDGTPDATEIKNGTDSLVKEVVKIVEPVKTEDQKVENLGDIFKNPPPNTTKTDQARIVGEKVISTVKDSAKSVVNNINNFAENQGRKVDKKKEEVKKEIEEIRLASATTTEAKPSTTEGPIKTAYVFLLSVLSLFFNNRSVFYLISIFILYYTSKFLIRWMIVKFSRPKKV